MNVQDITKTQRQSALISGIAIVVMTIAAVLATDVTLGRLVVENEASVTLQNIRASQTTFTAGILSWLIILISDVFAAWGLYVFFRITNKDISLLTAWFRLVYAALLAISIYNLIYVWLLTEQPAPNNANDTVMLAEKVMFYLNAFDTMFSVSLIVFGIHIFFLGYLSLKSAYIPRIFGTILLLASVGYTIPNIFNLLFPTHEDIMKIVTWIFILPMFGEVALGLWLLIFGLRKIKSND